MKAIIYREYGSGEACHVEEVEKPTPRDDEVLVRIRAAALNPLDYHLMSGAYMMRPKNGFRHPKPSCPGAEMAGAVEAVGANVTRFKPGDAVFGSARSTCAEYVCVPEDRLALKPSNSTFEEAAGIPVAGSTALQGLRDKGRIQSGQKILINGASGGVGTFAVQIAKSFGAEVTGICSTKNLDLVRSIGADDVIDYTVEDVAQPPERYDMVFDCVGNRSLSDWRKIMKRDATMIAIGAKPGGPLLGPVPYILKLLVASRFVSQRVVFFIAQIKPDDLVALKDLIETKRVTPVIDRSYELSETAQAIRYLKEGHARGKVVITVS
jgi:NADPH:quinone reductase-like Zn-dependent oxidoreductase